MASCHQDCDPCVWNSSVKWCCSGYCVQFEGQAVGYCQRRDKSPCPNQNHPASASASASSSSSSSSSSSTSTTPPLVPLTSQILLTLLGLVIIVLIMGGVVLFMRRRQRKKDPFSGALHLSSAEIRIFLKGSGGNYYNVDKSTGERTPLNGQQRDGDDTSMSTLDQVNEMPYDRRFEVPETGFALEESSILGAGAFGVVVKGRLWNDLVAVKTLKPNADKIYMQSLLTEIKVLIYLGRHPNIVCLLGAHTSHLHSGQIYLFLELCGSSLLTFLRQQNKTLPQSEEDADNKTPASHTYVNVNANANATPDQGVDNDETIKPVDLLTWAVQICNALRFLADKKVIHGDVAARNVLLYKKNTAKLTDFGLSRRLYEYSNYVKHQQEPLPWRWMSLESLRSLEFSTQSDVWSFGVTLWEMWTLGDVPYPGLSWSHDFIYKVLDGLRPCHPRGCKDAIYELMTNCWKNEAKLRPTFSQLYARLVDMLLQEKKNHPR